jgi:hypothetical protein
LATVLHYHCGIGEIAPTMAPAQKKVVLRSLSNELAWGYLPQGGFLHDFTIKLMAVDGRVTAFPFNYLKQIAYVKDFNLDDKVDPERIGRSAFLARPRGDGLWLRLTFLDDQTLEGLAPSDLTFADAFLDDRGLFLTPPDPRSNTHRLFVPRHALKSLEVLGVVTAPSRRLSIKPKSRRTPDTQTKLFGE